MYNHKFLATKMSQNKSITKSVTSFLPSFDLGRNMATHKYSFGRHFEILRNQFSIFYKIVTFDGLTSFLLQRLKFREIYLQFSLKSWCSTFWQVFSSSFAILGNFFLIFFKILTYNVLTSFLFQVPHVGTNVSWYVCFAEYSTMIRTSKFRPKILRLLVLFQKTNMMQLKSFLAWKYWEII